MGLFYYPYDRVIFPDAGTVDFREITDDRGLELLAMGKHKFVRLSPDVTKEDLAKLSKAKLKKLLDSVTDEERKKLESLLG